ncbi:hypothetical protein [Rugosimonospora africana]|uniref:Uncharacterized protein n=1 Tax=Rugosimonospora africana TaxID=556532 RepID=A0A8J3VQ29_9ACTN|nr:hypothetical protein [Rugosimonospora africana]GIH14710.1 hypothetical protein Raf01_28820 [Rugosimonospora africana]
MPKFSGRGNRRGFSRSGGTVTVLETRVHRSSARNARVAFILTTIVIALLTMTIASDYMNPVLALLLAAGLGPIVGALVWVVVRIWPVLRVLWWWTPEITSALALVYGWLWFADATDLVVRLIVVAALGGSFAIPPVRRRVWAVVLCLFVRHRLRVCFAQFIIANQSGTLPFILMARPTPVGERVWIYLRPGLDLTYLQASAEKIAVACSAAQTVIERVNPSNAAFLRVDIKRREVLTATVKPGLTDLVGADGTPIDDTTAVIAPSALDLPDVADPAVKAAKPATTRTVPPARPAPGPVFQPTSVTSADGEDVSDLIDF